jgi:hypothetical protein
VEIGEVNGDGVVDMHESLCSFFDLLFDGGGGVFVGARFGEFLMKLWMGKSLEK